MVRLTRQYVGGGCAGFGLGLMVGTWLSWSWGSQPWLVVPGSLLIAIGASVARAAQRAEQPSPASHAQPGDAAALDQNPA
jgi:hypothetical protein